MAYEIYHVVPTEFIGSTLYPLNALPDSLPQIYAEQVAKYRGRPELLSLRIPYLDCQWNDVLHFSPVHPARLRDALTGAGFDWKVFDWFEVDPLACGIDHTNAVIYTFPAHMEGRDFSVSPDDFVPFSTEVLEMLNSIPKATTDYFNYVKAHDERPFLFNFVPHVLYHGTLNVSQPGVRRIIV
ncbi:MAG: hypothetical protein ACOCYT_04540 [Chloroflexota bacterium]